MSAWLQDETTLHTGATPRHSVDIIALLRDRSADRTGDQACDRTGDQTCDETGGRAARITASGTAWLVGASARPRSTLSEWEACPGSPAVLPCGSAFDVVNVPALFGRHMLEQLWAEGPGSGPVATYRGRMLLFATPGTAQRLPTLLAWEEWGAGAGQGHGSHQGQLPPVLCHGIGDAITVPPLACTSSSSGPRWLVAPDTRNPWLPGPEVLLWACVKVGRSAALSATGNSIFPPADPGANVYDVSRRR